MVGLREAELGSVDLPDVPAVSHAGTLDDTTALAYLGRGRVVATAVEREIAKAVPGVDVRATPQGPTVAVAGLPIDAGQLVEFLVHDDLVGRVAGFLTIGMFVKQALNWARSHSERVVVDDGVALVIAADAVYNVDQAFDLTLVSCSPMPDLAAGQTIVGYTVIFRNAASVYAVLVSAFGAVSTPTIVEGGSEIPGY
jgi:hypothetical protein